MSSEVLTTPNTCSSFAIQAWLEDIQLTQPQHDPHPNPRKRSISPSPSPACKKVALAAAHGNTMASSKRRADDGPDGPNTPKRLQPFIHEDETPRVRPTQISSNSLLNHSILDPSELVKSSSDALTQPSASKKSQSSSPVKNLGALKMTDNPVEHSNEISEMPCSGRDLYKKLLGCKSAQSVLPSGLKDEITTAIGESDSLSEAMFDQALTFTLDRQAELIQVKRILRKAQKCRDLQDAEPGWNEQVHSRVIELALEGQTAVAFQNITTAKIHPRAFNPSSLSGALLQGKMVDYAICLEPDSAEPMFKRMRETLRLEPVNSQYINHTSFEPVRFRPIVVSIETKIGGGESEATTQLCVWVVAHFKRLQLIILRSGVTCEMMVLPLIYIQGHDWFAMLAVQQDSKTILYGRVHIGATDTILGIYKVLAALKILRQWANTVFRDWFYKILVPF